jgi:hypothetical protein
MLIASVDSIVRAGSSPLAASNPEQVSQLTSKYFGIKVHNSLYDFSVVAAGILSLSNFFNISWLCIHFFLENHQHFGDQKGIKAIIMTHSSIHVNVAMLVGGVCAEHNAQVNYVASSDFFSISLVYLLSLVSLHLLSSFLSLLIFGII